MNDHDDRSPGQLLQCYVKQHSQEAFRLLVERFTRLVYHTALRRTGHENLAVEVVQDVFIALAKQAPSLRADDRLGAWLHRRCLYIAANRLRGEVRRRERESTFAHMNLESTTSEHVWPDAISEIDPALNSLAAKDREALTLRYLEGRSLTDVGLALGTSKDATQKRVSRAMERLRAVLIKRGIKISLVVLAQGLIRASSQAAPVGLAARVHVQSMSAVAKGGVLLWFHRFWPAARSALVGASGAAVLWVWPLLQQHRALGAVNK